MGDEELYLEATKEVEGDNRDDGLWAKAMTLCDGDEKKAKYEYIRSRVKYLKEKSEDSTKNEQKSAEELTRKNAPSRVTPDSTKPVPTSLPATETLDVKTNTTQSSDTNKREDKGASQQPHKQPIEKKTAYSEKYQAPRPWVRFWARSLDVSIFLLFSGFLIGSFYAFLYVLINNEAPSMPTTFLISILLGLPTAFAIDAICMTLFGNTPGKAILRINVTNADGSKLSFRNALLRNMRVYLSGYGLGIPLVQLVTFIVAYNKLKNKGKTSWDEKSNFIVSYTHIGIGRILLYCAVIFIYLIISARLQNISLDEMRKWENNEAERASQYTEKHLHSIDNKSVQSILAIGNHVPEFELMDSDGKLWKISAMKGKVVFINFWATWCATCKAEMPDKEKLIKKMNGRPFQMLGVLFRDDPRNVPGYLKKIKVSAPTLIDPNNDLARLFGITGVPETFILDKEGILRERIIGPREWGDNETVALINDLIYDSERAVNQPSNKGREASSDRGNNEPSMTGPLLDPESDERMVTARIKEYSDNPVALSSIGDEYFEAKRYAMAIKVYEKVLELNPRDVDTYNDLGLSLHFSGRSDEAIIKLKEGTEIDPTFQRIWLSLGFVLILTGQTEEARGVLEKTIEIDPESGMAQEARNFISNLDKIEQ